MLWSIIWVFWSRWFSFSSRAICPCILYWAAFISRSLRSISSFSFAISFSCPSTWFLILERSSLGGGYLLVLAVALRQDMTPTAALVLLRWRFFMGFVTLMPWIWIPPLLACCCSSLMLRSFCVDESDVVWVLIGLVSWETFLRSSLLGMRCLVVNTGFLRGSLGFEYLSLRLQIRCAIS